MIKLDDNLLQELGLGSLPPDEKKRMLAHIYETLEMRVGMELAKQMSDAQLSEFEQFINRNDEAGALRWLETNFPNYKDVVAAEFEKLKAEIKQAAPQILASSQQHAQQIAGVGQYPPQPYGPAPAAQYGSQPQQQVPYPQQGSYAPSAPGYPYGAPQQQPMAPAGQPMYPPQPVPPQHPQPTYQQQPIPPIQPMYPPQPQDNNQATNGNQPSYNPEQRAA